MNKNKANGSIKLSSRNRVILSLHHKASHPVQKRHSYHEFSSGSRVIHSPIDPYPYRPYDPISPTKAGEGLSWVKTKGPHGAKDTRNMLVIVLFIDCTNLNHPKPTPSPNSEPKPTFGQVQDWNQILAKCLCLEVL